MLIVRGKEKTKNDHKPIGWEHLTKVELKYTLYCKAGIGSNPIMITKRLITPIGKKLC